MDKYWFKPKDYGWGLGLPITWQGWMALVGIIFFIVIAAFADGLFCAHASLKLTLRFFIDAAMISTLFCFVFQDKVEGGLKWRWGCDQASK